MNKLVDIGRIIFAIPFLVFGFNHFFNWEELAGLYVSYIPIGVYSMLLTGAGLIAAGISIIFKKYVKLSCLLLAFMLLIFIVFLHIPNIVNHNNVTMSMTHLFKDLGLLGGALMIAGLFPDKNVK